MHASILAAALLLFQPSVDTRQVRSIKFENFKGISAGDIMNRLKDRGVRVMLEQLYEPQQMEAARVVLKEFLEEKGRRDMDVRTDVKEIPPRSVEVTFKAIKN